MGNNQPPEEDQYQTTMALPPVEPERASIVKELLDTNQLLDKIRFFLLGYYVDENQDLKQNKDYKLVNEKGCRSILFEVSQRITSQVVLGKVEEIEAKDRAKRFEIAMAQKLVNSYDAWDITNVTALDIIVDSLGDLIFFALTRPIQGMAHRGIIDITQLREHTIQRDTIQPVEQAENVFKKTLNRMRRDT